MLASEGLKFQIRGSVVWEEVVKQMFLKARRVLSHWPRQTALLSSPTLKDCEICSCLLDLGEKMSFPLCLPRAWRIEAQEEYGLIK